MVRPAQYGGACGHKIRLSDDRGSRFAVCRIGHGKEQDTIGAFVRDEQSPLWVENQPVGQGHHRLAGLGVGDSCESALAQHQIGLQAGVWRKGRRESQHAAVKRVGYEEIAGSGIDRQSRGITKAGLRGLPGRRVRFGRRIRDTAKIADGGLHIGLTDDNIRQDARPYFARIGESEHAMVVGIGNIQVRGAGARVHGDSRIV